MRVRTHTHTRTHKVNPHSYSFVGNTLNGVRSRNHCSFGIWLGLHEKVCKIMETQNVRMYNTLYIKCDNFMHN